MRKRSGTLEIGFRSGERPEDYEGEYQCFANNNIGAALSNKILLRVSSKNRFLWNKKRDLFKSVGKVKDRSAQYL